MVSAVAAYITTGVQPWKSEALCSGLPPDPWFNTKEEGRSNVGFDAKEVCAACPVAHECLTYAVSKREEHGIWGGCGGSKLRKLCSIWAKERGCDGYGWQTGCDCEWCVTIDKVLAENTKLNSNGAGATHGIRATYARGCRCFACKLAASKYSAEQRRAA